MPHSVCRTYLTALGWAHLLQRVAPRHQQRCCQRLARRHPHSAVWTPSTPRMGLGRAAPAALTCTRRQPHLPAVTSSMLCGPGRCAGTVLEPLAACCAAMGRASPVPASVRNCRSCTTILARQLLIARHWDDAWANSSSVPCTAPRNLHTCCRSNMVHRLQPQRPHRWPALL